MDRLFYEEIKRRFWNYWTRFLWGESNILDLIMRGSSREWVVLLIKIVIFKGIKNVSELRDSLWKFYVVGWGEKKKTKFLRLSIGYDDPIEKYQKKNKDKKSISKSKSLFPDMKINSKTVKKELDLIADFLINKLTEKQRIPTILTVKIVKSDLENKSKCMIILLFDK